MPSNVKVTLLDDGVVDTLVSVGTERRSPLRFHQRFGQRVNLLAWHIAILPFEKLVYRAPLLWRPAPNIFLLWAANSVRGSPENGAREEQPENDRVVRVSAFRCRCEAESRGHIH